MAASSAAAGGRGTAVPAASSSPVWVTCRVRARAAPLSAARGAGALACSCTRVSECSMATAGAARHRAPPPWHERLQASVADLERAAAALLAVCEEPDAQAALEARACACGARGRRCGRGPSPCTNSGA